ncbi:hypothetical protein I4U23_008037 [Adineta vaga]|nr:hypothetical protein I4U23_008037 [Adineta vaga]
MVFTFTKRCLFHQITNQSTILITTPQLLLVDSKIKLKDIPTISLHTSSSNSQKDYHSYYTPQISSVSIV